MRFVVAMVVTLAIGVVAIPVQPAAAAAAFVISTAAGTGGYASSGDGGLAINAQVANPAQLAFDSVGNMYFADNLNRIRKITTGGIITTVAGTGSSGSSGDGGAATSAKFNSPNGVAFDSAGNMYIADSSNNKIRKVTVAGIISTFAGNGTAGYTGDGAAATAAELNYPSSVAFDASDDLFIGDYSNNVVRKITPAGIITTVAGTGTSGSSGDGGAATSAKLNEPVDVRVDANGNLFIADYNNSRIRKVTAGGTISTIAGTGIGGYSGDGGPATSAKINGPQAITLDASGDIFVADFSNHRIREVATSGIISTVAGTGVSGYSGDGGAATSAQLNGPDGVVVDASGNLFISDTNGHNIREVALVAPASGNTAASVTVDPSFSFGVAGASAICSGFTPTVASSATSVPLGHIGAGAQAVGSQALSVLSNAGGGFLVTLRTTTASAPALRSANAHAIADVTAGPAPSPSTEGFGFATGDVGVAMTSGNLAPVPTSAGAAIAMSAGTLVSSRTSCVAYLASVSSTTPADTYSATVVYTATPTF